MKSIFLILVTVAPFLHIPNIAHGETPKANLEFRLAVPEPTDGHSKRSVPDSNQPIYVSPVPVLTGRDIEKVSFYNDDVGNPIIGFVLSDGGSEKMWTATSENIGKQLAILLNGKVVSAPFIRQGITKEGAITGQFDDEDLLHFFEAIVLQRPAAPDRKITTDKDRLQGTWVLKQGESNGTSLAELLDKKGIENFQIKISEDSMTMSGFGKQDHQYLFTLKPDESPRAIDTVIKESQGLAAKGTTLPGIYKIDDNTLTLCLTNDASTDRPQEFKAPKGSRLSWLVLVRKKP